MFLVPSIQDINFTPEKKCLRYKSISGYIFIEKEGKIYKFEVSIPHLGITDALETYLNKSKLDNCRLQSERYVKLDYPLNLIESVGKFRLEGNLYRTKNYFVPRSTALTDFLYVKYKFNETNVKLTSSNLEELSEIYKEYSLEQRNFELDIIKTLISNVNIELKETYDFTLEQLNECIENIDKILGNLETIKILKKIRILMNSIKSNSTSINALGIENKFIEAIEKDKEKQKVK